MTRTFQLLCRSLVCLVVILTAVQPAGVQAEPQQTIGYIQGLINSAADGAILTIPAGTFTETLTISNKNLTLQGASSSSTILQPSGAGKRVIYAQNTSAHTLTLKNLKVTGGQASGSYGGGVFVDGGGSLIADSCIIQNNSADYGGGLYIAGSATLTNTQILSNTAAIYGGGMVVWSGSTQITGGVISSNTATSSNGGGINVNNSLTINGTSFSGNSAGESGGAVLQWNAGYTVEISNATFSANTAKVKGGGILAGSYVTLANSTFTSNIVDSGNSNNTFGGGIYASNGLYGSRLIFTNNQADCLYCAEAAGGGIFVTSSSSSNPVITASQFTSNYGWNGAGISASTSVSLEVDDSGFINNTGGYGGGIDAYSMTGNQLLFQGNSVVNDGGAIDSSRLTISNSRFIQNSTQSTGSGGAIMAHTYFSGWNLVFSQNNSNNGTALYLQGNGASGGLYHTTIAQAAVMGGSAVVVNTGTTLTSMNNIIANTTNGYQVEGTLNYDYTLFWGNGSETTVSGGTINYGGHAIVGQNPLFVSPATFNFHLQSTSPAIGFGTSVGVTKDLDGFSRNGRYDLGAYEYFSHTFVPIISKP